MAAKPKVDYRSLRTLKTQLKEEKLGQLYVFHGEETYLREYYLDRVQKQLLPPGTEAFNFKLLEGKETSARDITAAADCLPMMAARTLVLVRDYDLFKAGEEERKILLDYFADLPEYLCLIFLFDTIPYKPDARTKMAGALKEHGLVVEFPRQQQNDLVDWIIRRFKATGHSIDTETARYFLFLCGDLMHNLAGEIGKIGAYAKAERITRQDIDALATPQLDAVVFQLTDHLSAKNYDKALGILADLLHMQESPQNILGALGKYLRQLYAARVALETRRTADDLAALWGMHPYPAGKLMAAARRVDLPRCRAALERAAQADLTMKSTGADPGQVLTDLVLSLAYG